MATMKLTTVQKQVMERFENGEKLVQLETNRRSGDVLFWCSYDKKAVCGMQQKRLYIRNFADCFGTI